MTTIVCNRQSMAADKRASGLPLFKVTKMFKVNGSLIGVSGAFEQALKFIEWRKHPEIAPQFPEESQFAALELRADGKIFYWSAELIPVEVQEDYYALGSGAPYALGALAMGASLKEAIKVAARWDEATGKEVQTMNLKGK